MVRDWVGMKMVKCLASLQYFSIVGVLLSSVLFASSGYSLEFPKTNGTGAPERTASGGRRDELCLQEGTRLPTVLAPQNNVYTTVSPTPSLFFYLPVTPAKTAELVLMDNQGNELAQEIILLTGKAGVMEVQLPDRVQLEVNQIYRWELAIICNVQDRTQDLFIQGKIQRQELSAELVRQLENEDLLQQAQIYTDAGIWQESLAIALQLRYTHPDTWEELLQSVGLENLELFNSFQQ